MTSLYTKPVVGAELLMAIPNVSQDGGKLHSMNIHLTSSPKSSPCETNYVKMTLKSFKCVVTLVPSFMRMSNSFFIRQTLLLALLLSQLAHNLSQTALAIGLPTMVKQTNLATCNHNEDLALASSILHLASMIPSSLSSNGCSYHFCIRTSCICSFHIGKFVPSNLQIL